MMSGMSDEYGYGAEVLAMTFRLATRSVAAEGITKGAGGYSRHLAAHAHAWMPLADALAGAVMRIGDRLEKREAGDRGSRRRGRGAEGGAGADAVPGEAP